MKIRSFEHFFNLDEMIDLSKKFLETIKLFLCTLYLLFSKVS